jgi:hypothetical protein
MKRRRHIVVAVSSTSSRPASSGGRRPALGANGLRTGSMFTFKAREI